MSHKLTRREVLKLLGTTTGAIAISSLPNKWVTPIVEFGALPAHAQGSSTVTVSGYLYSGCSNPNSPLVPHVIRAPSNGQCQPPATGTPIQGATVKLQNTNNMTTTGQGGFFTLQVPPGDICLVLTVNANTFTVCLNNISPGASICITISLQCAG